MSARPELRLPHLLRAGVMLLAATAAGAETRKPARTDLRGDPLPAGALARLGTVRLRHGGGVPSIAFSPDGKRLISAGYDSTLRVWEAATGKQVYQRRTHYPWVACVAVSPDGKVLASGGADNSVRLWDLATGKELRHFGVGGWAGAVYCIAFAPGGRLVAAGGSGSSGDIRLYEAGTGKEVRRLGGHKGWTKAIAFSPDGKTLASGGVDRAIRLWDVDTGRERRRLGGHQGDVNSVAFSADGRTVVSGGDYRDRTIRIWDVTAGTERRRFPGGMNGLPAAFGLAPDGKTLACGVDEDTVVIREVTTGKELRRLKGSAGPLHRAAFSPDGRRLVTVCYGTIRLWDATTGREVLPGAGHDGPVYRVAFSPDGKTLATGGEDKALRLWEAATGREAGQVARRTWALPLAFSADGKSLITAGTGVRVWDTATGRKVRQLGDQDSLAQLAVCSTDGRVAARVGLDHVLRFWDTASGKELHRLPARSRDRLALSPDGRLLALVDEDEERGTWLRILDATTGRDAVPRRPLASALQEDTGRVEVSDLTFSADGRSLAVVVRGDGGIRLLEAATGRGRCRVGSRKEDPREVSCVALSPDGGLLASGGTGLDNTVHLWDLHTGKELPPLVGHEGYVTSLAFAPDGRSLASASNDTTVLVWDAAGLRREKPAPKLSARDLEALWQDLAGPDAAKAYRAIGLLVAGHRESVPFLRKRLHPVAAPPAGETARLVADLDSEVFAVREKATRELARLGERARPALEKALAGKPSLEVRRRVEGLLGKLQARSLSPEELRSVRAVEALERIATPEARRVLERLAGGDAASPVSREASASLKRRAR